MIQTTSGRSVLLAALCICNAQTFVDGSANAIGVHAAFKAALNAYVGSSTEAAVVPEIHNITHSTEPPPPASPQVVPAQGNINQVSPAGVGEEAGGKEEEGEGRKRKGGSG
ncbi:hypothetical protein C8R45DRAFT_1014318 [Mycena sanguinolenta]|nr:hypothetical protein C8R45DRAFT_1014318 [Mycena sanguinolenta]